MTMFIHLRGLFGTYYMGGGFTMVNIIGITPVLKELWSLRKREYGQIYNCVLYIEMPCFVVEIQPLVVRVREKEKEIIYIGSPGKATSAR